MNKMITNTADVSSNCRNEYVFPGVTIVYQIH
jgi:hypothetical protein